MKSHNWYDCRHYSDVIMNAMTFQITSLSIFTQLFTQARKNSASQAFVRGIHRYPANFPHNGPVTREMFSFYDVIMELCHMIKETFCLNGNRNPNHFFARLSFENELRRMLFFLQWPQTAIYHRVNDLTLDTICKLHRPSFLSWSIGLFQMR